MSIEKRVRASQIKLSGGGGVEKQESGRCKEKKTAASQKQKSQLLELCSKQLVPKTEREDKVGSVWTGAGPGPKPEQADGKIII